MSARPAALVKAESLYRYAKEQGTPLSTFALAIDAMEAFELLDYLQVQNPENELLALDISDAKAKRDPWPVLGNFVLMGLSMVPKAVLN